MTPEQKNEHAKRVLLLSHIKKIGAILDEYEDVPPELLEELEVELSQFEHDVELTFR